MTKRCRKILLLGIVLLLLLIVIAIDVPLIIMDTKTFTRGDVEGKNNTTFTGKLIYSCEKKEKRKSKQTTE